MPTLQDLTVRHRSWPYLAPFGIFVLLMELGPHLGVGPDVHYPIRVVAVSAALFIWSRQLITLKASRPAASIAVGLVVFGIWIAPDVLWPAYRSHWLFQNFLTGSLASSVPPLHRTNVSFLIWRSLGLILLVPVIEEIFWRGWLMRYLISRHFENVPLGTWSATAFWLTAALFASEHGPFWDVGLVAGVVYNWLMIRTRNLADCILAHAVTNTCLAVYVFSYSRWEYLL